MRFGFFKQKFAWFFQFFHQVYKPTSHASHFEVPSDFFNKTADEVKREQIARFGVSLCTVSDRADEFQTSLAFTE